MDNFMNSVIGQSIHIVVASIEYGNSVFVIKINH